mgnify:CR=1 FL=1
MAIEGDRPVEAMVSLLSFVALMPSVLTTFGVAAGSSAIMLEMAAVAWPLAAILMFGVVVHQIAMMFEERLPPMGMPNWTFYRSYVISVVSGNRFVERMQQAETPTDMDQILTALAAPHGEVQYGFGPYFGGDWDTKPDPEFRVLLHLAMHPRMIAEAAPVVQLILRSFWIQTGATGTPAFNPEVTRQGQIGLLGVLPRTPAWNAFRQRMLNAVMVDPRDERAAKAAWDAVPPMPADEFIRVGRIKIPTSWPWQFYNVWATPPRHDPRKPEYAAWELSPLYLLDAVYGPSVANRSLLVYNGSMLSQPVRGGFLLDRAFFDPNAPETPASRQLNDTALAAAQAEAVEAALAAAQAIAVGGGAGPAAVAAPIQVIYEAPPGLPPPPPPTGPPPPPDPDPLWVLQSDQQTYEHRVTGELVAPAPVTEGVYVRVTLSEPWVLQGPDGLFYENRQTGEIFPAWVPPGTPLPAVPPPVIWNGSAP